MRVLESRLVLGVAAPAAQGTSDTTAPPRQWVRGEFMRRRHGWHGIVGAVVWIAIVVYLLWLGTRLVRAVERLANKTDK